jgi:acylphosphatase
MNVRKHVIFRGEVQGVFFRHHTQKKAISEGVTGWVRNLPDGSVEAVFEGDESRVEKVIEWCRKNQPYAKVTSVSIRTEKYRAEFKSFEIIRW